jgi:hypothetical protein
MTNITFVTAFINIYEKAFDDKNNDFRYNLFEKIAKTGIRLCLYTDAVSQNELSKLIEPYPNVKLMKTIYLEETFCHKICESTEYSLPERRCPNKDTMKFIILQNSKVEFMDDAIQNNPWNTSHFAWIDFSIAYIFKNLENTLEDLSILSRRSFPSNFLIFPGCWNKLDKNNVGSILNQIHWRFCGGFFMGDSSSLNSFFELYKANFENFIQEHRKLVWEVNFWAWLEANTNWNPSFYNADHNDSIINIPTRFYALQLNNKLEKTYYDYPTIENFFSSSPAYLYKNGEHILNTRFVNYSYSPSGSYDIKHPNGTLITKNIVSVLNSDFLPNSYNEMDDTTVNIESHDTYSIGLEDIRLYTYQNTIKFIATNVNYIGDRANRMIIGNYDPHGLNYSNCQILQPPTYTGCEKNWIPIIKDDTEYFIYKWSPFQLGKMNTETNTLEITESYEIRSHDFHRIRGSTIFIDKGEFLLGVVHFCEETYPRQYYHMLVTLDRETLKPLQFSDPFCFQHIGVEFCIGFTKQNDKYVFWISKKDNDAIMVKVNVDEIPICHTISHA